MKRLGKLLDSFVMACARIGLVTAFSVALIVVALSYVSPSFAAYRSNLWPSCVQASVLGGYLQLGGGCNLRSGDNNGITFEDDAGNDLFQMEDGATAVLDGRSATVVYEVQDTEAFRITATAVTIPNTIDLNGPVGTCYAFVPQLIAIIGNGGGFLSVYDALSASATDCSEVAPWTVPREFNPSGASGQLTLDVVSLMQTGGTGTDIVLQVSADEKVHSAAGTGATDYASVNTTIDVPATIAANDMMFNTFTTTGLSLVTGDTVSIQVCRIGGDAADTYTGTVDFAGVRIGYSCSTN